MKTIFRILLITLLGFTFFSCLKINDDTEPTAAEEQSKIKSYLDNLQSQGNNIDTTSLGVYYVNITNGTGQKAKQGDTLTVGYAGYFISGYVFDTSYWHNQTDSVYTFVLGNPAMIKGWDDAMKTMNKGAKSQFIIPSALAYGSTGSGIIPPYQTLVFVVIMKDIKPK